MLRVAVLALLLASSGGWRSAFAQEQRSPYAGEERRDIKALSPGQVDQLLDGAGMGLARAAELNGVPGPRHVLDMADQLELTDAQRAEIELMEDRMHEAAVRLGQEILELEEALDRLFAVGPADPSEVEHLAGRIGQRSGLLRAVHLLAHLETAVVLRPAQIHRYGVLRGYDDSADPRHESGHQMGEHEPQHRPR
jgi:Spy/CpxP family protein refolding chaperone